MIKLHSTLQHDDGLDGDDDLGVSSITQDLAVLSSSANIAGGSDENQVNRGDSSSSAFGKDFNFNFNFIGKASKMLMRRIFQANAILLDNQASTQWFYHFLLFIEFLQLFYFAVLKLDIKNEFVYNYENVVTAQKGAIQNEDDLPVANDTNDEWTNQGYSSSSSSTLLDELISLENPTVMNSIRIDTYLQVFNFPIMALAEEMTQSITDMFLALNLILVGFIITSLIMSKSIFKESKRSSVSTNSSNYGSGKSGVVNGGTQIAVKTYSIVLIVFLSIFELPMLLLYIQMFMCDENQNYDYVLDVTCTSTEHQVMLALSTVLLIVYLGFVFLQKLLFTTRSYDLDSDEVPWAALSENKVEFWRFLIKVILASAFIFDKSGNSMGYINIIVCLLLVWLLFIRLYKNMLNDWSVYIISIIYEAILAWIYLCVGIDRLSEGESEISVVSAFITIFIAVSIGIVLAIGKDLQLKGVLYQYRVKDQNELTLENRLFQLEQLAKLIESHSLKAKNILFGFLCAHLEECQQSDEGCECYNMAQLLIEGSEALRDIDDETILEFVNKGKNKRTLSNNLQAIASYLSDSQITENPNLSSLNAKKLDEEGDGPSNSSFRKTAANIAGGVTAGLQRMMSIRGGTEKVKKEKSHNFPKEEKKSAHFVGSKKSNSSNSVPIKLPLSKNNIKQKAPPNNSKSNFHSKYDSKNSSQNKSVNEFSSDIQVSTARQQYCGKEVDDKSSTGEKENGEECKEEDEVPDYLDKLKDIQLHKIPQSAEQERELWFQFLLVIINKAALCFPNSVDIKIFSCLFKWAKLHNEFKAIFDLLQCEQGELSLQSRFMLYRIKMNIQQTMISKFRKQSEERAAVDMRVIYRYEKLYQRYLLLEYVAANSALGFWRELIQKNVDAVTMKRRGSEISKNYLRIQDVVEKLLKIYPNEFKFLYRYGLFLMNVVNNDNDAYMNFEKIFQIFTSSIYKRTMQQLKHCESNGLGENSSSAIVIITATSRDVGTIIHANEGITPVLGYLPHEIIGSNVSVLMPSLIGDQHDKLIQRAFHSSDIHSVNMTRVVFAQAKTGYLRPVQLQIRLLPVVTNQISFLGSLQGLSNSSDHVEQMFSAVRDFEHLERHFIMTDDMGNIRGITEKLINAMGLNAKFFQSSSHFRSDINLRLISPDICDPINQHQLVTDGLLVTFDTREILNFVEQEQLQYEEILEIRSKMSIFQIFAQLSIFEYSQAHSKIHIYRIFIVPMDFNNVRSQGTMDKLEVDNQREGGETSSHGQQQKNMQLLSTSELKDKDADAIDGADLHSSEPSTSSCASSHKEQFSKMIQEFKRALRETTTPRILIVLNRIIVVIILIVITLSGIAYSFQQRLPVIIKEEGAQQINTETRFVHLISLTTLVRSQINIANELGANSYHSEHLKDIDRFTFLSHLVQNEAHKLQVIHNYINKKRTEINDEYVIQEDPQAIYEGKKIPIKIVDDQGMLYEYELPYRIALESYLNSVVRLNHTTKEEQIFPFLFIQGNPDNHKRIPIEMSNEVAESVSMILLNGLRHIRERTSDANEFQREIAFENTMDTIFLIFMIVGILISVISTLIVVHYIWQIEQGKADILSLYAHLKLSEIKAVYDRCDEYLDSLGQGDDAFKLEQQRAQGDQKEISISSKMVIAKQQMLDSSNKMTFGSITKAIGNTPKFSVDGLPKLSDQQMKQLYQQQQQDSNLSDEAKEEAALQFFIQKQQMARMKEAKDNFELKNRIAKNNLSNGQSDGFDNDIHAIFAKLAVMRMKEIQERMAEIQRKREMAQYEALANPRRHTQSDVELSLEDTKRDLLSQLKNDKAPLDGKSRTQKRAAKHPGSVSSQSKKEESSEASSSEYSLRMIGFKGKGDKDNSQMIKHQGTKGSKKQSKQQMRLNESQQREDDSPRGSASKGQRGGGGGPTRKFQSQEELENQYLEQRKVYFERQLQQKNWKFMMLNIFFGLLFSTYFIYNYFDHVEDVKTLKEIKDYAPDFFDRYSDLMLSFSFMRERILNNGSLQSFVFTSPIFKSEIQIDDYYKEMSLETEKNIAHLKVTSPNIIHPMITFIEKSDSVDFCSKIIGELSEEEATDYQVNKVDEKTLKEIRYSAYQTEIKTVVVSCTAAAYDRVDILIRLKSHGVDLNLGDYDRRTPLHIASANGHLSAVKYLLSQGVDVNPIDRWGSTPLNGALHFPHIKQILIEQGGFLGTNITHFVTKPVDIHQDQFRLYYAALHGDVQTMENLRLLYWNVNGQDYDGRTALSIAASEGQLEAVQYLVTHGADVTIEDWRGHDPLSDAIRENRTATVEYLKSIISEHLVKNYCTEFEDGFLSKGIMQAFGIFHKKLSDLQIVVNNTKPSEMINLLHEVPSNSTNDTDKVETVQYAFKRTMATYFASNELYLTKILSQLESIIRHTQDSFIEAFISRSQITFFAFVIFQVFLLIVLRKSLITVLKEDMFQSRGILNLIPPEYFEENRDTVEKLIKQLQN